jgi:hypothetical protein
MLLACIRKRRPLLQNPMDRAAPAAPLPQAPAHVATGGLQTRDPFGLFQTK